MRVAILHFHLRGGGVTRVIEMSCAALVDEGFDPLVISGEAAPSDCRLPSDRVAVVPELAYDTGASQMESLRLGVENAMKRRWGVPADVIHLHNHALGKNFALPLVASQWAKEGRAVLLQLHDFAESGRPWNYRRLLQELGDFAGLDQCLYPVSSKVGYALLNSADRERLLTAGLPAADLLPNPVALPPAVRPVERRELSADRLIVYPTRAIRRKNIGEAVFLSALAGRGDRFVLTAAPVSGPDLQRHSDWVEFSSQQNLPLEFDAQKRLARPSTDFIWGADLCLTTSVEEGFGMAFLEPWLAGKPLAGRDLSGVTRDFRDTGLKLDRLYGRLDIPENWVSRSDIESLVERGIRSTCDAYQVEFQPRFLDLALGEICYDGKIDFGRLDETLQRQVIEGLVAGRFSRDAVPASLLDGGEVDVGANRQVVGTHYTIKKYGRRLLDIYRRLTSASSDGVAFLESKAVLEAVLRFEDFFALRV